MQTADIGQTRAYFDKLAPTWDEKPRCTPEKAAAILAVAAPLLGAAVLDVGSGTGVMLPYLLERGVGHLHAVDLSPAMVAQAQAKHSDPKLLIEVRDLFELGRGGYDLALVYNAYPHFEDKARFGWQMHTLLRPGGRLLIAHGMGRDAINGVHAGSARDVSDRLGPPAEEASRLGANFRFDVMVDEAELYILSGVAV